MFHAGRGGNPSAVKYGFDPSCSNSGHYNRHLRSVMTDLNERRKLLCQIKMPGSTTQATGRTVHDLLALVPHERADEDTRMREGVAMKWYDAIDGGLLPARYAAHPVVR